MPVLQPLGLLKENCAEFDGPIVVVVSESGLGNMFFGKPRNFDPRGILAIFYCWYRQQNGMAFGDAKLCDFYWEVQRQQSR